jgi:hypothetical protein
MPKNKISEYSSTASSNTDIGGINIAEGCPPSNINNAIRELMAQVKDFQIGADGDGLTVSTINATTATFGTLIASFGAVTATSLNVSGGSVLASASISGALTSATANITTATIGAIQGTNATLTNALPIASGGTALTTLTAENVILGNGTSAPKFVAPGTTGNVLTSNGTTWTSAAPPAGGVTSFNTRTGAVTLSTSDVLTANADATAGAIGTYAFMRDSTSSGSLNFGSTRAGSSLAPAALLSNGSFTYTDDSGVGNASHNIGIGSTQSGTWRCMGVSSTTANDFIGRSTTLWLRIS